MIRLLVSGSSITSAASNTLSKLDYTSTEYNEHPNREDQKIKAHKQFVKPTKKFIYKILLQRYSCTAITFTMHSRENKTPFMNNIQKTRCVPSDMKNKIRYITA